MNEAGLIRDIFGFEGHVYPEGVTPYPLHRSNPRSLLDWRWCAWDAFVEVGGTDDMHTAGLFETQAQAFYSGQVTAFDKVLYMLDVPPLEEASQ